MLKLIIAALLGFSTLSAEENNAEELSAFYIGCGNGNLLIHDFVSALSSYEIAEKFIDRQQKESWIGPYFLISWGRIIAYDNLGLRDQCEQTIGALVLVATSIDDDEEDDDEEDDREFIDHMLSLANLAPSSDVRQFLFSIFEEEKNPMVLFK